MKVPKAKVEIIAPNESAYQLRGWSVVLDGSWWVDAPDQKSADRIAEVLQYAHALGYKQAKHEIKQALGL